MNNDLKSLQDFDLKEISNGRIYYESPDDWEDQVLYFALVDRFSDGNEQPENLFNKETDEDSIFKNDKSDEWNQYGCKWNGGNIKGVQSKLDYLKNLGITVVWITPIFKQTSFNEMYHGYGIQDFLEIDPHFGTREDLKELVEAAHAKGIRIILDVVLNHAGDVFTYEFGCPIWSGEEFDVIGFRNSYGNDNIPIDNKELNEKAWPNGSIWPKELQTMETFERKGEIVNWDQAPEFTQGDFYSLKSFYLGKGDVKTFEASKALQTLTEAYKYWIAYADIDGFRIDTVKHMTQGATHYFVNEIRDFAYTLNKKNFYLIGEVTGGVNFAYDTMNKTGLNAVLGINDIATKLEDVAKGIINPTEYFSIFCNHEFFGEQDHLWFKDNIVTMFDDHDMVTQNADWKYRFCAQTEPAPLLSNALFLNTMTLGIPCIYYGTEQAFDGSGGGEIYVRESMFGGKFGAFRSQGKHFFDEKSDTYLALSRMLKLRKEHDVLRQGRQYLREISGDGEQFGYPHKLGEGRIESIVAWSRIFNKEEMILAMNTNTVSPLTAYVAIDQEMHEVGDVFKCILSINSKLLDKEYRVEEVNNRKTIKIEVDKHNSSVFAKV